jgi:hypothetical protein
VPREIRGSGAAHGRWSTLMSGRSPRRGACAVMRAWWPSR